MYWTAVTSENEGGFCGHLHRSWDAAEKCRLRLSRKTGLIWWIADTSNAS